MKLLIINKFGDNKLINGEFVPRIGDTIDLFYVPLPVVSKVVCFPSSERLSEIGVFDKEIQAIIILD